MIRKEVRLLIERYSQGTIYDTHNKNNHDKLKILKQLIVCLPINNYHPKYNKFQKTSKSKVYGNTLKLSCHQPYAKFLISSAI